MSQGRVDPRRRGGSGRNGGATSAFQDGSTGLGEVSVAAIGALVSLLCRVIGAFLAYRQLTPSEMGDVHQAPLPEPLFLVLALAAASLPSIALQKPWAGRKIASHRMQKIFLAGAFQAIMMCAWMAGLRSCGPIRAFLVEGAELPLLYLSAVITRRDHAQAAKTRGALLMVLGYLLLFYEVSGQAGSHLQKFESSKLGRRAGDAIGSLHDHTRDRLNRIKTSHFVNQTLRHMHRDDSHGRPLYHLDDDGLPARAGHRTLLSAQHALDVDSIDSHTVMHQKSPPGPTLVQSLFIVEALRSEIGVALLLFTAVINQATKTFTRRLAMDIGGAKRYFSLSSFFATLAILPWASTSFYVVRATEPDLLDFRRILTCAIAGTLYILIPFYLQAFVGSRVSARLLMRVRLLCNFRLSWQPLTPLLCCEHHR